MRKKPVGLWIAAGAGYAFLYIPLVIVIVYSFNNSRLNAEWVGFTFDWYDKLFHDEEMLAAAGNSLAIALTASLVSTALGTMAGVAMYRYKLRLLPLLVLTPIAIPEILMGVSLLIFFVLLNVTLGLVSVTLAHITFCIGFVAIVVRARLAGMDEALIEAARDCGATPWQSFRFVTLPLIKPTLQVVLIQLTLLYFIMVTLVFTLTGGGPLAATDTLALRVLKISFEDWNLGRGAALGLVITAINFAMSALYVRALRQPAQVA